MKTKPRHFDTEARFSRYVLECAIRDRQTFVEAITPRREYDLDKDTKKQIKETEAEIAAMKERKRLIK